MKPGDLVIQLIDAVKNKKFEDGLTFDQRGIHLTEEALTELFRWTWNPNNRMELGGLLFMLQQ